MSSTRKQQRRRKRRNGHATPAPKAGRMMAALRKAQPAKDLRAPKDERPVLRRSDRARANADPFGMTNRGY